MTNVAVIIVNWNGKKDTIECLASVSKLSAVRCQLSAIVIDNASTDGSVTAIKKLFPKIEIIQNSENLGFSGGNNLGIKKSLNDGADFVWLLNNDTTVDKNALSALLEVFKNSLVGIAGSKIYFYPGCEFHRDRYKKSELGKVLWYAGGIIDWNNMYASHRGVDEVNNCKFDKIEETEFVTGCSMMVKRELFEKIGLLDEKFFAYLEDLDFCLRAKRAGYKLLYVPNSIIWHKNAGSSGVGSGLHQYYMTRNRLLAGMRYAPVRTKLALLRQAARYVASRSDVRRKAVLDALMGKFGKQL